MDGTENEQDNSSAGEQGTSEKEPEMFTRSQLDEAAQKEVSNALSKAGRDAKTLALKAKDLDIREQAIKEAEARREAEALEAVRDDPDQLKAYQDKKSLREERKRITEERANLERDKLQHAEEIKAAAESQLEIKIWDIAKETGADAAELKDTLAELGIQNPTEEQIKAAAKRMGGTKTPLKVDSGKTRGGVRSFKQIEQDYADGKISTADYMEAMKVSGKH
jgi:hypothetical protein